MQKVMTTISSVSIVVALLDGRPWLAFGIAIAFLVVGAISTIYMGERVPRAISARIASIGVLGIAASFVTGLLCNSATDRVKPTHPSMSPPKPRVNKRPLDDEFQKAMEKASRR